MTQSHSWTPTSLDSLITQIGLPLFAERDGVIYPSGTACFIGGWLAITARHVVRDYLEVLGGPEWTAGDAATPNFQLRTYVLPRDGKQPIPLAVRAWWCPGPGDIAILKLDPLVETGLDRVWSTPCISLLPPREGSHVSAFGYPGSKFEPGAPGHGVVHMQATTTRGRVVKVHHQQRDASGLPFPCFQTNMRIDGGMSGGPVFDEGGRLCGIMCKSLSFADSSEEPVCGDTLAYARDLHRRALARQAPDRCQISDVRVGTREDYQLRRA